jgi:hypothetical protein
MKRIIVRGVLLIALLGAVALPAARPASRSSDAKQPDQAAHIHRAHLQKQTHSHRAHKHAHLHRARLKKQAHLHGARAQKQKHAHRARQQ